MTNHDVATAPSTLAHIVSDSLSRGDIEAAQSLLDSTATHRDGDNDGEIALARAYCDLATYKLQRAYTSSRRAASLLHGQSSQALAVDAYALLSRLAAYAGCGIEAVEAATVATRLAEDLRRDLHSTESYARAYLSLGAALGAVRAYEQCTNPFQTVAQFVERHGAAGKLEVLVERLWVSAFRWVEERQGFEPAPAIDGVSDLRRALEAPTEAGAPATLTPGTEAMTRASGTLLLRLLDAWSEQPGKAFEHSGASSVLEGLDPPRGWVLAAESWLQAEVCRRSGDLSAATLHAARMSTWAEEAGHLPMALLGHYLASDLHRLQGQPELAIAALHQQRALERKLLLRMLPTRGDVAHSQLAARQSERQIETLAAESDKYKRWAYEDAKTGIANLRRFDQCLDEWTAAASDSGEPLCVALLDVDRFKSINDEFGHDIGDQVLHVIAQQMTAHVRDSDLPARWGGDEFAVLFRNMGIEPATHVAERIQSSVRDYPWNAICVGLKASVSVGVVEALPGDSKESLVKRSDQKMYQQKHSLKLAELEASVPTAVLRRVVSLLRRAKRVAILVGSAGDVESDDGLVSPALVPWDGPEHEAYCHASILKTDPEGFQHHWQDWRKAWRSRRVPSRLLTNLVALSSQFPQVVFVTERVDGVLAMAGADNVIELYGNAFRNRCVACGRVNSNSDAGRCLACDAPGVTLRPDIVLLGEYPDRALLAGAELQFKLSDVVLVVDCDARTLPGAGLLDKARSRESQVVLLGANGRTRQDAADIAIPAAATSVVEALLTALKSNEVAQGDTAELSDEGFKALCFLTGQRADNFGVTFAQALQWTNLEVHQGLGTLPWVFPLPTRSGINPEAPMPTLDDFKLLGAEAQVRKSMAKAFKLMLRYYGFDWRDGLVERRPDWRQGFATWALEAGPNDFVISRILGALQLCGLSGEARAFLDAITPEVERYRGSEAALPLRHWRQAVSEPSA